MHAGAAGNPGARPLLLGTVLMLLFLTISVSGCAPPLSPPGSCLTGIWPPIAARSRYNVSLPHLYVLLAESCGKLGRCWLARQMVDSALPLFCEQTDWSPHRHGQQIHAAGRPETASRNASRRNSSGDARKGVHEKVPLSAADL